MAMLNTLEIGFGITLVQLGKTKCAKNATTFFDALYTTKMPLCSNLRKQGSIWSHYKVQENNKMDLCKGFVAHTYAPFQ